MDPRYARGGLMLLVVALAACGGTPSAGATPTPSATVSSSSPKPQSAVDPLSLDVCALFTTALGASPYASRLPAPSSGKLSSTDRTNVFCDYRPQPTGDNLNLTILNAPTTQAVFDGHVRAELARGGALYGPQESLNGVGDSAYNLALTAPTTPSKMGFGSIYLLVRGVEIHVAAQEQTRSNAEVALRCKALATQVAKLVGAMA